MTPNSQQTVFIADDDLEVSNIIARTLQSALAVNVVSFTEGHKCLKCMQEERCDLLISRTSTVGMTGTELLRRAKCMFPPLPVIMVGDNADIDTAIKSMKRGAFDFCTLPADRTELLTMVENALAFSAMYLARDVKPLTTVEQQVLRLLLKEKSTREIAALRNRSVRTIEDQRCSIMRKLCVESAIGLVRRVESTRLPY